jgi:hypothetical protein
MGEPQRRLTLTKQRCTCVALRARYAELLRLREFVKHIEGSAAGGVEISLDERVLPVLPGAQRVPCVTMRRRPKL